MVELGGVSADVMSLGQEAIFLAMSWMGNVLDGIFFFKDPDSVIKINNIHIYLKNFNKRIPLMYSYEHKSLHGTEQKRTATL